MSRKARRSLPPPAAGTRPPASGANGEAATRIATRPARRPVRRVRAKVARTQAALAAAKVRTVAQDGGRPVVGISLGDPCGIGPEVLERALRSAQVRRALTPVIFGDASFVTPYGTRVAVTALAEKDRRPGKPTRAAGRAQLAYVEAAIEAAKRGELDAICTAPVSKEQITRAGVPFVGHTELLAEAFDAEVLMLMDGPRLSVALATNHAPIAALPRLITVPLLLRRLRLLSRGLAPSLGRLPRLAVCGLNPHAGEGGTIGREEQRVIAPAIARARAEGLDVEGPFAADGLFARHGRLPYDAVLAMFHDQGLVATKVLDFDLTVNVTLGLPLPRTSPDHGVAYDLAGTGRASERPMIAALLKAAALARAKSADPRGSPRRSARSANV